MTSRRRPPRRGFAISAWWIVPVAVLIFVGWDAVRRSRHLLDISSTYGVAVDAPKIAARSPTGYEDGRRSIMLPPGAADASHWIMQTQQMLAHGPARIRHVDYDNAPTGRDVHWASPFRWWLALLAWIDHHASGRPLGIAVERAALASGPAMLALLFAGLMPLLSRKFSRRAAALAALGAVAVFPFYTDFLPGRPDHHGLANIAAMATVLFFVVGAFSPGRGWFIASGLAGGVGLWISAATQIPVLIGVGVGVLGASWLARAVPERIAWLHTPALLRTWAWAGGGTSLAAYLLEYFPGHLGLRLEVNHPLYAAAWIGAGEALRAVTVALRDGRRALPRRDRIAGIAGGIAVLALPAIILGTAGKIFTVMDPFVWRLHTLYIAEFISLPRHLATEQFSVTWLGICLPVLMLAGPLLLFIRRSTPPETKALLWLAGAPALVGWALGWDQIRWLGLAFALTVPLLAMWLRALETQPAASPRTVLAWTAGCALLFAPGAIGAAQRSLASVEFTREEIRALAQRDVAHALALRSGGERTVVLGAPTPTTALLFHGGFAGIGTLYWENADGLKHASAVFAATTNEEAHALVRRMGITHLVLFSWDAFEVVQAKLYRGIPEAAPIPPNLFIANLLSAPVPPPWLRALPFKLPDHPVLAGDQVRIWEVVDPQTPAVAAAHAANYFLEMGQPEVAGQFTPILTGFRDNLIASAILAGIASRRRDAAAFATALERVTSRLAEAKSLPLDDHIHLVVVLTVAQREQLAREHLRLCFEKADARSLRRLSAGTVSDLLALGEAFGLGFSDPALTTLAQRLLPPAKRK